MELQEISNIDLLGKNIKLDVGLSYSAPNSELWLRKLKNRIVFGFEPNKECVEHIIEGKGNPHNQTNIYINKERIGKDFFLIPYAIDDCDMCYKKFYSTSNDLGCSSLYKPTNFKIKDTYDVLCMRLRDFLDKLQNLNFIEHIKVDAQGNDLRVLKSMGNYLDKTIFVTIECANERSSYECIEEESGHTLQQLLEFMKFNKFSLYESPICDIRTGNVVTKSSYKGGNYTFVNDSLKKMAIDNQLDCSHFGM